MQTSRAYLVTFMNVIRRDFARIWRAGVVHIGTSGFITRGTALAQRVLLARLLGAENIGHIAVITTALSLIRLPAGVGTFTVVNKLVAENDHDVDAQREVVGTSIWVNLVTTVFVGILAWFILSNTSWINDQVANRLLRILVFFLPFMILSEVFRNALMGQRRMRTVAGIDISFSLIAIIAVIPMVYVWYLSGWFINQVLVILLSFGLFAWSIKSILSLKWNREISKKIVTIGGFAFLGQLVGSLLLRFDTLSVSAILGDPAVTGIYNTASLVAQQMIIFPGAILIAVFPVIAQNRDNPQNLKHRYWELFRKIGALSLGLSVFMWLICPWIFSIFGEEFVKAVAPFRILILGFVARSLFVLDNTYLDALGRTDITFVSGLLAALSTIVLNLTFIPKWGVIGAAWATTLSIFVSLAIRQAAVHYFIFQKHAVR